MSSRFVVKTSQLVFKQEQKPTDKLKQEKLAKEAKLKALKSSLKGNLNGKIR